MKKGRAGAARSFGVARGLAMASGVLLLAALLLDLALAETTSDSFCLSCHEMATNIGGEFEHRLRLLGSGERHASCSECHLPQEFVPRLRRKLRAGRELYHHLIGTLATPERFEARRMVMARAVWRDLRRNRSGECTSCHDGEDGEKGTPSAAARSYHERADAMGVACIDCHKGIAHELSPQPSGEEAHGGEAECLECHEPERVEAIWRVSHSDPDGVAENPPSEQCRDCHGPGSSHSRFPLDRPGLRRNAEATADASERRACIECHREGSRVEWDVRAHGFSEATCGSCHRIHPDEDAGGRAAELGVACAESCHIWVGEEDGAAAEGAGASAETSCMSCHDPHLPPETSRCESCHPMDGPALAGQSAEARGFHERGEREHAQCEACHKGIIHKSPHVELMDGSSAAL